MWKNWMTTVLGGWLFLSAFVVDLLSPVNLFVAGILGLLFGFWGVRTWPRAVNGVLALWIAVSAFVPALISPVNFAAVGLAMMLLGFLSMRQRAVQLATETNA